MSANGRRVLGGHVPIECLDKPRTIHFDLNALAALEAQTGRDVLDPETWRRLDVAGIRAALWAGLLHEDPELSIETVGTWVTMDVLPEVVTALRAAYAGAMPEAAETDEAEGEGDDAENPTTPSD